MQTYIRVQPFSAEFDLTCDKEAVRSKNIWIITICQGNGIVVYRRVHGYLAAVDAAKEAAKIWPQAILKLPAVLLRATTDSVIEANGGTE